MLTYRFRRRVRRPRDEGIAPLSELLDRSLEKYNKVILIFFTCSGVQKHKKGCTKLIINMMSNSD